LRKTARKTDPPGTVVVSARGAIRLRSGHPWVYRSDILSAGQVNPGALAPVTEANGKPLGSALYSTTSEIAVRMISDRTLAAEELGPLLRRRIREAIAYRRHIVGNSNAYRVIFSEADFLPGLIVDRYDDLLSVQILTQGMDQEAVRAVLLDELTSQFHPAGIVERVDERIRQLEQLPPRSSGLLSGEKTSTVFTMNGVRFQHDGLAGQKTGAFLDQRENYAATTRFARGEALDVFCYQGGFALHLAGVCARVTGVDSSRTALETADENAALNGREIEWIEANAFDLLREYSSAGRQYDTVVLDPPAFAKNRRTLETALRGYKELNLRALKMLRPGGTLITCSCSYHVGPTEFLEMLRAAAADAHRPVRILDNRTQSADHPVLLAVPETHYLKCAIASVG